MFDLGQFFEMGGFGAFIWPSYAICFGLLIALAIQSISVLKQRRRELEILEHSRANARDAKETRQVRKAEE